MDRKDFLKKSALTTGGFVLGTSVLSGCGDSSVGGILGGEEERDPYEEWSGPLVNGNPYPAPDFSLAKKSTDDQGYVGFDDRSDNSVFATSFSDKGGNPLSDLEVTLYREYKSGKDTGFLLAEDSNYEFMPNMISLKDLNPFTRMYKADDFLRCNFDDPETPICSLGPEFPSKTISEKIPTNFFIQELIGPLPSYDPRDMDDLPGYLYVGDWSFDDLSNVVSKVALVLSFIPTGGFSAKVYAIVNKVNRVLGTGNMIIEGVNLVSRLISGKDLIDPGKEYSVYATNSIYSTLNNISQFVLFPSVMSDRADEQDIKYLFPINEGNSWTFSDGQQKVTSEVIGNEKIKGEELVVIKDASGLEQYFGYHEDSLYQQGFKFPEIGSVFFDPPLEFGDSKVRIGRDFPLDSKIIFKDKPDYTGSIKGGISWVGRENVLLSNKKPYGDCYKFREEETIEISGPDSSVSEDFIADHWLAKNLGKVKVDFSGQTIELVDSNINSRMQGFGLLKQSNSNKNMYLPTLSQKIQEAYRRVS